jgi:hypothetical protein
LLARIDLLERAVRERGCEACALRGVHRRRRVRQLLAVALGLLVWAGLFALYAVCSAYPPVPSSIH